MPDEIAYRRLRAPRDDGQVLVDPSLSLLPEALRSNVALRAGCYEHVRVLDRQLEPFALAAREELFHLAMDYTSEYLDLPSDSPGIVNRPVILAGHQPQLFHAGVWYKNFVLSSLASETDALAINLVVDNDASRADTLRVPTGSHDAPRIEHVPLDAASPEIPYEERRVLDPELFDSFAARVSRTLSGWIDDPLVNQLWPQATAAAHRTGNLGQSLARARHSLEHAWGLQTLEVPLSRVCDTTSFIVFALHLLTDLARLHSVYNTALAEYRRANHLRSHSHPVPDLHAEGGLREAPLWIWTTAEPRRRPLYVEQHGDRLRLTNRASLQFDLPLSGGEATDATIEAWQALRKQGIKLRPRALITTLYSRLVLSDLFLHGIGGAKYDQLTDALFQRFFEIPPPQFGTVTATLKLPIPRPDVTQQAVRHLAHDERELPYHPESYLPAAARSLPEVAKLIAEKQRLVHLQLPKGERLARHHAIVQVNQQLLQHLPGMAGQVAHAHELAQQALRLVTLLGSREFSFALFPRETLREQLLDLAAFPL